MNTIDYAGQSLADWPASRFVCPWGIRPGDGRFLTDSRTLQRVEAAIATSGCADLVMSDGERTIRLQKIYLLAARPVDVGIEQGVATFLLELADRRVLLSGKSISGRYNMYKPDRQLYFPDTINSGNAWTWQGLVTKCATALGIGALTIVGTPAGTPGNVVWDEMPAAEALEELLGRIGQYVTYNPITDAFSVRKVGQIDSGDQFGFDTLLSLFFADGMESRRYSRPLAPASVKVLFPLLYEAGDFPADEPTDPEHRFYSIEVNPPEGLAVLSGQAGRIFWNDCYAVNDGSAIANASEIGTIATARAEEFYAAAQVEHADYELGGLHALAPNSLIRRAIYISDEDGARTLVRLGNPDLADSLEGPGSSLILPERFSEGTGVRIQSGRPTRIEVDRGVFWARVKEDLGSDLFRVARIISDESEMDLQCRATKLGSAGVAVDDLVLIASDGEGKFCFLPFEREPLVCVPYMIDQAHPDDPSGPYGLMFNDFKAANAEQRILLRAPAAFWSAEEMLIWVSSHSLYLDPGSGGAGGCSPHAYIEARLVKEAFDEEVDWTGRPETEEDIAYRFDLNAQLWFVTSPTAISQTLSAGEEEYPLALTPGPFSGGPFYGMELWVVLTGVTLPNFNRAEVTTYVDMANLKI